MCWQARASFLEPLIRSRQVRRTRMVNHTDWETTQNWGQKKNSTARAQTAPTARDAPKREGRSAKRPWSRTNNKPKTKWIPQTHAWNTPISSTESLRVREHSCRLGSTNLCPTNAVLMWYTRMPSRTYDISQSAQIQHQICSSWKFVDIDFSCAHCASEKTQRSQTCPNVLASQHFQKMSHSSCYP